MSDSNDEYPSPFDRFPAGPIAAGVADGERIQGYDVAGDLARHYSFTETTFLALTGELPTDLQSKGFDVALHMLSSVTIADASAHAARVARHVHSKGEGTPATATTAGIAVAEHARYLVEEHAEWLEWLLGDRTEPLPAVAIAEQAQPNVGDYIPLLDELPSAELLTGESLTLDAAALAVLVDLGFRADHEVVNVVCLARLPIVLAEAFAVEDPRLWKYPLNLPYWVYEPEEE